MKKDVDHCLECGSVHYWTYNTFMSKPDKKRQLIAILCSECSKKEFTYGKIDLLFDEVIKILDKQSR